jgi:TRAP-type C4-dicarboxylate transport system permease small subunit
MLGAALGMLCFAPGTNKPAIGVVVTNAQDALTLNRTLQSTQRALALLSRGLGFVLVGAAAVLLVAMSGILFLQVIYRYVLLLPLPWSEEAARFCLVWFAMLSSCIAGQQGAHFSIRWCLHWVSPRWRELARLLVLAFSIVVFVFLAYTGFLYLAVVEDLFATATQISMFWVYLAIPVGCGSLALIQTLELLDAMVGLVTHRHFGRWRLVEDAAFLQLVERDE